MPKIADKLKYLFTAGYSDGEQFVQTKEDVSRVDNSRNCFYDVDHSRLDWFALNDGVNAYAVDLRDGHLEINGTKFFLGDEIIKDRILYYCKRVQEDYNIDVVVGEDLVPRPVKSESGDTRVWFRLGWSGINAMNGEMIERFIEFE